MNHQHLGIGEILEVDTDNSCYSIKFEKVTTPRSIDFRIEMEKVE